MKGGNSDRLCTAVVSISSVLVDIGLLVDGTLSQFRVEEQG